MTKTFSKIAAQGDFIIIKIDKIPYGVGPVAAEDGRYVIAHSETGHNHVMASTSVKAFALKKPDIYALFLQVDEPTDIVHLRGFDTHEPILVGRGSYMVRRQREYTPEGFRRAQD
jgi:hypothetical protein